MLLALPHFYNRALVKGGITEIGGIVLEMLLLPVIVPICLLK